MNIFRYLGFTFAIASLAIGISGIIFLSSKPDLPFEYTESNNKIEAAENYITLINKGDIIEKINGINVSNMNQVEFLADMLNIGDEVSLEVSNSNSYNTVKVNLEKEYKNGHFIFISSIIGLTFWSLGFLVFIKKQGDFAANLLFAMLVFFAMAIMTSPGKNDGSFYSYYAFVKVFHLAAYVTGIILFIHFSLVFPKRLYAGKLLLAFVYTIFLSFCILMNYVQLKAISGRDISYIDLYHTLWTVLLYFLLTGTVWAMVNFCISFFKYYEDSERRKVQWALWGILMGVFPYIFFWVIPNLGVYPVPIKEEFSIAFFIFIPVSFVIGISRYKLFDIEYIFSKSIVYFTVTVLITSIFFLIIYFLNSIFSSELGIRSPSYAMVSAIFIAILFNPLRIKVQKFVDKYFFRVKYDFKIALRKCNAKLSACNTSEEIGNVLLSEINEIIPNKKSAILLKDEAGEYSRVLAVKDVNFQTHEFPDKNPEKEFSAFVGLALNPDKETGRILLGEKLSGIKFLDSDFEILKTFAGSAVTLMNRIELREQVIRAEIEKKRLEELNSMKSEFVSSVSHELKTPLTSIQMFAETLMSGKEIKEEKLREYAGIIYGESERLTRMINNILDFSKIERGIKQYYFENISLKSVLEYVLDSMEYQFEKNNVRLSKNIYAGKVIIAADRDGVAEAIINLISNAIKYSGEKPEIEVSLIIEGDKAVLSVKDNGKGIEEKEVNKIFDKFYRIEKENEKHIGGAGIGLAIVKNIMTAHNGEIKVSSEPGKGSTFSLIFKIMQNQN